MSSESYRNNLNYYSHHQQQQPQQQQPVHYQQPSSSNPNAYLTLLALADSFQKAHQYRLAIHCLESILTLKNQDLAANTNYLHVQLKTRLNLCRLYLKHTLSTNQQVNAFLEKSVIYYFICGFNFLLLFNSGYICLDYSGSKCKFKVFFL